VVYLSDVTGIPPWVLEEAPADWVERMFTYYQAKARAEENRQAHVTAARRSRQRIA
jgi:hypothetical protein